jgi:hypothetical protein
MWASLVNLVAPEPSPEDALLASIKRGSCDLLNEQLASKGADYLSNITFES